MTGRGFEFARSLSTWRQCVLTPRHHSPLRRTPGRWGRTMPSSRTRSLRNGFRFFPLRPVHFEAIPKFSSRPGSPYRIPGRCPSNCLQDCMCRHDKTRIQVVCKGTLDGYRVRAIRKAGLRTVEAGPGPARRMSRWSRLRRVLLSP